LSATKRNESIGIMGTDLQNGYFMDTRGKANVINAVSTFGTTIGGAFQPIAE
jgi:hypothetical protein